VQLRYDYSKRLVARATWSTGIGPPGCNQLTSRDNFDAGAQTITLASPRLKPIWDNAFDLSLEYYTQHSGIFSVGFFDKEFTDYVINLFRIDPNFVFNSENVGRIAVSRFTNIGSGYARGIEAEYTQKFPDLPGVLGGLGFSGNVTYVKSSIEIRPGNFSSLPNTSELT